MALSEKQKMLAGELYNSTGPELVGERHAAQRLLGRYNATDAGDAAKDAKKLTARVAGTELEVRTQNYKIRSRVGSYDARMPVRSCSERTTCRYVSLFD